MAYHHTLNCGIECTQEHKEPWAEEITQLQARVKELESEIAMQNRVIKIGGELVDKHDDALDKISDYSALIDLCEKAFMPLMKALWLMLTFKDAKINNQLILDAQDALLAIRKMKEAG